MSRARVAVVGVGHLGKVHARLLAQVAEAELIAVVDRREEVRRQVAAEHNVEAHADFAPLRGRVDGVILAAPTDAHGALGLELLRAGAHLFVEKPLARDVAEAEPLVRAAAERGLVLQTGHSERFNPAWRAAREGVVAPRYLEATRVSPYGFRCLDVGVVLDVMIHDIDLALELADSELVDVRALGGVLLGPHEDFAQARLAFANGFVANLSACRTGFAPRREIKLFAADHYVECDLHARKVKRVRPTAATLRGAIDPLTVSPGEMQRLKENFFTEVCAVEDVAVPEGNPLLEEQRDFARCVRTGGVPRVDGVAGLKAVAAAEWVLEEMAAHRWEARQPAARTPMALPPAPASPPSTALPLRKAG